LTGLEELVVLFEKEEEKERHEIDACVDCRVAKRWVEISTSDAGEKGEGKLGYSIAL
jgi:hypothetical protein